MVCEGFYGDTWVHTGLHVLLTIFNILVEAVLKKFLMESPNPNSSNQGMEYMVG